MAKIEASKEVLLDGAQMALTATIAGTMGFLKKQNMEIQDWIDYIGEEFEGSWGDLEGRGADEVMSHILTLEILPLGTKVISSEMTADKAEVVLEALPGKTLLEKFGTTPREILGQFGITQTEYSRVLAMYKPAAEAIGLRFKYQLKGGHLILTLEAGKK